MRRKGFPGESKKVEFSKHIYFAKEGEKGLTSTKANEYANLAREVVKEHEQFLRDINLSTTTMSCISVDNKHIIKQGITLEQFGTISSRLKEIAEYNALVAWLREAIEAKENLLDEVNDMSIYHWCNQEGIEYPHSDCPIDVDLVNNAEKATVKEVAEYHIANAIASVYGQFIHKDGIFASKRDQLFKDINNPISVSGEGRDSVIYEVIPSISVEEVQRLYLELQEYWRAEESHLNKMKYDWNTADQLERQKVYGEIKLWEEEQSQKRTEILNWFKVWKENRIKELQNLKIMIPNSLYPIFERLRNM